MTQNQIDSVKGVPLKLLKMVMQWTTLGAIVWMGVLALVSIFGYCISGYIMILIAIFQALSVITNTFLSRRVSAGIFCLSVFKFSEFVFLCNGLTPYFTVQKGKWLSLDFDIDSDISFVQIILFPDVQMSLYHLIC